MHAGRFPIYPQSGLDDYARSRMSPLKRSTSDHGQPVPGLDLAPQANAPAQPMRRPGGPKKIE